MILLKACVFFCVKAVTRIWSLFFSGKYMDVFKDHFIFGRLMKQQKLGQSDFDALNFIWIKSEFFYVNKIHDLRKWNVKCLKLRVKKKSKLNLIEFFNDFFENIQVPFSTHNSICNLSLVEILAPVCAFMFEGIFCTICVELVFDERKRRVHPLQTKVGSFFKLDIQMNVNIDS